MKFLINFSRLYGFTVFLLAFSLPFYFKFNNWVLGLFYLMSFIYLFQHKSRYSFSKRALWHILPMAGFFVISLIGMLYSSYLDQATKDVVRMLPLLLTPIAIIGNKDFYRQFANPLFLGLVLGCLTAVLICWGNAIAEMMINKEPLSYFFRWRHMNHQLTAVIGMHAGYLALFIAFSVAIIIYKYKGLNRTYRLLANLVLLLFSLFLFSLMARAVLGFFILSALLYFLIKGKWKLILAFVIVILSFGFIATQVDDQYNYLLDKTVYQLPLIGKKGDKTQRFERLGATKYMFLEHPIIGVGNSDSKQFRQKYYLETGDKKAYKNQFNAHNQFFEFLDEYGLIGALIYIAFFVEVIILSWKKRDYLFLYLSLLFLVANLTESMLQRTHGIVFCAIFFSLFLSKYSHKGLSSNKVINN